MTYWETLQNQKVRRWINADLRPVLVSVVLVCEAGSHLWSKQKNGLINTTIWPFVVLQWNGCSFYLRRVVCWPLGRRWIWLGKLWITTKGNIKHCWQTAEEPAQVGCVSPGAPAKPWTGIMMPSVPPGNLDMAMLPGGPASPVSITGSPGRKGFSSIVRLLLEPWGSPTSSAAAWTPEKDRQSDQWAWGWRSDRNRCQGRCLKVTRVNKPAVFVETLKLHHCHWGRSLPH